MEIQKIESHSADYCEVCSKNNPNFPVCGKCKSVRYCGPECQKSDWEAHKKICGLLMDQNKLAKIINIFYMEYSGTDVFKLWLLAAKKNPGILIKYKLGKEFPESVDLLEKDPSSDSISAQQLHNLLQGLEPVPEKKILVISEMTKMFMFRMEFQVPDF